MPPRRFSRHMYTEAFTDEDAEVQLLTDYEPFDFRELPDNVVHVVKEGDTLWTLAGRYFAGIPRASGLWWVIADFQPTPIHDPTIALELGARLVIPSLRTVQEEVFNPARRTEG